MEELQDLESREKYGIPSKEVFLRKKSVATELGKVLLIEEISWWQKSRTL